MESASKLRFEYCLNQHGTIHYMRALQGHSGGVRVDPTVQSNVKILCGWTRHASLQQSTLLRELDVDPSYESGQPRMVPYGT